MAKKYIKGNPRLNLDPTGYKGRNVNQLTSISGVASGGAFTVQLTCDRRYHAIRLLCQCVNYMGGIGLTTTAITGTGTGLTLTPTLTSQREPTTAAVVAGGSGYVTGNIVSLVDATGQGAQYTVTASSGVVSAVTYVAGSANASPCDPSFMLTQVQANIGSTTPYQVDPGFYQWRRQARGLPSYAGVLDIDFSDPGRFWLPLNDETSWDSIGAASFTVTGKISSNALKPNITGDMEFDFWRNSGSDAQGKFVFANPFKYVQQVVPLAIGVNPITNLTIFGKVARLWVKGANPGNISFLEMWEDGQKRCEGAPQFLFNKWAAYDFWNTQKTTFLTSSISGSNTLQGIFNPVTAFDAAYVADWDQRLSDALSFITNPPSHNLKLTSAVAQNATIYMECLPGKFI